MVKLSIAKLVTVVYRGLTITYAITESNSDLNPRNYYADWQRRIYWSCSRQDGRGNWLSD